MVRSAPVTALFTLALALGAAGPARAAAEGLEPGVQGYLNQHCLNCHGEEKQKGDFRIDTLSPKVGFENNPQWQEIMERISSGEMPPKKTKVRPAPEESERVVAWLSARMKE